MQYGYFDDKNREYVITRPDTPAPWVNYLGSPAYGAIISNNAGGYSFAKSGAKGRILRYVFNQFDQPGRYVYLRDNEDGDYWSASWQPVGKDLSVYKNECRHGMGYTVIRSEYAGIEAEVSYYVPMDEEYEVWYTSVRNVSGRERDLTLTGFCEFTNENNYENDQVNLQYSLFISRTHFEGGRIRQVISENEMADGKPLPFVQDLPAERFFGLAGLPVASYCGERDAFLGRYHGYGNPVGVEKGDLGNILNYNENSCGALSALLHLAPGETKQAAFVLGMKHREESAKIMDRYGEPSSVCGAEIMNVRKWWYEKFDHFKVTTPDPEFNTMINTWNAYNCFMTFIWSRAASFIYCGLRNGYGYRDTVQDIQGVIHLAPEMAAQQIRFMLSAQVDNGGGLPLVKYTHDPGHEDTPDDDSYVRETGHPAYRADDALWLFPTVYKYVAESGNTDFLKEVIPFANKDEGTVYEHLKRAVQFSAQRLGPHGLPAGLYADWNDCLRLGKNGESVFVAFQYYMAMSIMKEFALKEKDDAYYAWLCSEQKAFGEKLGDLCWDGDRFIRGFRESGEVIGRAADPEANMWLNPQSWAVISGAATKEQGETALEKVHELLNTDYGAMLLAPYYHEHAFEGMLSICYNPGCKENGGIFSQPQGWIILAEALAGHGDRAYEYYRENNPSAQNKEADIRVMEPYCYGQFTEGKDSPHFGRSHVHWLTGTASTVMVGSVEGILGMRPDLGGLKIAPSIPSSWEELTIEKDFRGKHLSIKILNPGHAQSGFVRMQVNGKAYGEPYIPVSDMSGQTDVVLYIS